MDKHLIELNDKERYLLWMVASMFQPPITSALMSKLFPGDKLRQKYDPHYEAVLVKRVIEYGKWLEGYRAKNPLQSQPHEQQASLNDEH